LQQASNSEKIKFDLGISGKMELYVEGLNFFTDRKLFSKYIDNEEEIDFEIYPHKVWATEN
jgi:hypothetical protein